MVSLAAFLFTLASGFAASFQVCLALGAPWGELTLGGRWPGRLPLMVRTIPILSAVLLTGFTATILSRAGVALQQIHGYAGLFAWVVVVYCILGCVANAITPSKREKALWLPIVAVMLVTSLVVAIA